MHTWHFGHFATPVVVLPAHRGCATTPCWPPRANLAQTWRHSRTRPQRCPAQQKLKAIRANFRGSHHVTFVKHDCTAERLQRWKQTPDTSGLMLRLAAAFPAMVLYRKLPRTTGKLWTCPQLPQVCSRGSGTSNCPARYERKVRGVKAGFKEPFVVCCLETVSHGATSGQVLPSPGTAAMVSVFACVAGLSRPWELRADPGTAAERGKEGDQPLENIDAPAPCRPPAANTSWLRTCSGSRAPAQLSSTLRDSSPARKMPALSSHSFFAYREIL